MTNGPKKIITDIFPLLKCNNKKNFCKPCDNGYYFTTKNTTSGYQLNRVFAYVKELILVPH